MMKDRDLVGLITIVALILLAYPYPLLRFIGAGVILFFSPGFFLTKLLYRDSSLEETLLLSPGISVVTTGGVALLLALFSLLNPFYLISIIGIFVIAGFVLSNTVDIKKPRISMPDKLTSVMIIAMLILIIAWGVAEYNAGYYREVDIAIVSWPHNATVNSTLTFGVYVANYNYGPANCEVRFSLNGHQVKSIPVHLNDGENTTITFNAVSNLSGKNIASFDLYVNGKYYTNVHIYFYLK